MKTIKDLLKENMTRIMKQKGMTQEALASLLNIETISVNRYVNKKRFPDAEVLDQIAKHLGVAPYELIKDQSSDLTKNDLIAKIISQLPFLETNDLGLFERNISKLAAKRSSVTTTNIIKKPVNI